MNDAKLKSQENIELKSQIKKITEESDYTRNEKALFSQRVQELQLQINAQKSSEMVEMQINMLKKYDYS